MSHRGGWAGGGKTILRAVVLAAGLAAGAIVALALTLIASVRRQRRDLALLKTLGFTTRQLAATVAWQASAIAAIAAVVGVPIGIAIGRQLWILFAHNINAVPQATVPVTLILVAAGSLILGNLVAAVPAAHGRAHARRLSTTKRVRQPGKRQPEPQWRLRVLQMFAMPKSCVHIRCVR